MSRVFDPDEWEHGLRCSKCLREFTEGQPISEELDAFVDDVPLVIITCVPCAMEGVLA